MVRARKTILAAALMLVAALVVAGPAAAKDRNHDKIPDHWEKQNRLSLEVKQTKRDQDKDGLDNLGEFRSNSDPRSDDSDDDGVVDGDENAGVITAFDGTTLTIDLYGGGSITGTVDDSTEVKCGRECGKDGTEESTEGSAAREEGSNSGPGEGEEGTGEEGPPPPPPPPHHGGPGHGGPGESEGDEDECSIDDLAVDVVVHEAEIDLRDGAAVFHEIELAK
jgi:hypothetical protein